MMREKAREWRKKTTQRCKRKREGGKEKSQKKRERERGLMKMVEERFL